MDELNKIEKVECGKDALQYFDFDEGWVNLNHGNSLVHRSQ